MKNREVDLLLVVNMFLTGFDATTLNTLWVDKNLRQHGLLQAFSRTNRILNTVKSYGNIVCFRDLKEATDEAIALFGDREAGGIVLLKTFDEYYNGYIEKGNQKPGYQQLIDDLQQTYPLGQEITGEDAKKDSIRLFGSILRLRNILTSFDDFSGKEILSPRDFQDYQSRYIDLYNEIKPKMDADKENINEDLVFELELIKQIEVNIDYILLLVAKYHESQCKDKDILVTIDKTINSSIELRSKKDLIERFISRVNVDSYIDSDWKTFIEQQKEDEMSRIISENNLKPEATRKYIEGSFRDGTLRTTGTDIDRILPAASRFGKGMRYKKRQQIVRIILEFFEKFIGLA